MFSIYPMLHISIKWCASLCSHHFVCYAFMPIMLSLSIMSFLFHASSPKRKNVNVFIKCHVFRKGRLNTVTQLREGKGREVAQLCQTLCNPMGLRSSSVHGIFQESTGAGCHFLLQRIFLIQGSNLGLPHCRSPALLSEPPGKSWWASVNSLPSVRMEQRLFIEGIICYTVLVTCMYAVYLES